MMLTLPLFTSTKILKGAIFCTYVSCAEPDVIIPLQKFPHTPGDPSIPFAWRTVELRNMSIAHGRGSFLVSSLNSVSFPAIQEGLSTHSCDEHPNLDGKHEPVCVPI